MRQNRIYPGLFFICLFFIFCTTTIFSKPSRNPDPLELLKNLSPPTVNHKWKPGTPELPETKTPVHLPAEKEQAEDAERRFPIKFQRQQDAASPAKPIHSIKIEGLPPIGSASMVTGSGSVVVIASPTKIPASAPLVLAAPPVAASPAKPIATATAKVSPDKPASGTASVTLALATKPGDKADPGKKGKDEKGQGGKTASGTASPTSPATAPIKLVASAPGEAGSGSSSGSGSGSGSGRGSGSEPGSETAALAGEGSGSATETAPVGEGEPPPEGEEPKSKPPSKEIMAEAEKLRKETKWKELAAFLDSHPNLTEDVRGSQIAIETIMNQAKVDGNRLRGTSEALLQKDPKDPVANLGLGYYWMEGTKKPDLTKALKFLSVAKSAKNPPEGLSGLYWKATMKKYWYFLLLLLGGIVGGVAQFKKKLKKAPAEGEAPEGAAPEPTPQEAPEAPPQGFAGKVKAFLARFQKKPAAAPAPAEGAQKPGEPPPPAPEAPVGFMGKIKALLNKLRRKPEPPEAAPAPTSVPAPTTADGKTPPPDGTPVAESDSNHEAAATGEVPPSEETAPAPAEGEAVPPDGSPSDKPPQA